MSANEIVAGKETVVRRPGAGWSFHLPEQHTIEVNQDDNFVALSMPSAGGVYGLARIEETDEEVIVEIGSMITGHATGVGDYTPDPVDGYPFPQIHDEFERLHGRWQQAGLPEHDFQAYATGSTHEDRLREIRRRLREVDGR